MTDWDSRESRAAANNLLYSISSLEFIVALQALSKLSSLLINVSRSLQQPGIDIMKALDDVRLVERTISRMRANIESELVVIYNAGCDMASRLNITICMPRVCSGGRSVYCGDGDISAEAYCHAS